MFRINKEINNIMHTSDLFEASKVAGRTEQYLINSKLDFDKLFNEEDIAVLGYDGQVKVKKGIISLSSGTAWLTVNEFTKSYLESYKQIEKEESDKE